MIAINNGGLSFLSAVVKNFAVFSLCCFFAMHGELIMIVSQNRGFLDSHVLYRLEKNLRE